MLKKISRIQIILLTIFTILTLSWASTFFIHSSEFWSIYVSKHLLNTQFSQVIFMKPLFHFFLYLFHLLPFNDVQHLLAVKVIFAIFGLIQLFFILLILKNLTSNKFSLLTTESYFLLLVGFSSTYFLQNFFRVRSDQICVTLFLMFIYFNSQKKFTFKQHILFLALYPLIGLKGILFSLLHAVQIGLDYKKDLFKTKYFFITCLGFLSVTLWTINLGWNSVTYLIYTTDSFATYFRNLTEWVQSDWLLIIFPLFSIFHSKYQHHSEQKLKINLSVLTLASLIIILLYPQKNNYFIASFIPILLLNTVSFALFLINETYKKFFFKHIITSFFIIFIFAKFILYFDITPYRSNSEQINFISNVSKILKSNNYTYIDGFGAFPRQNNMNCFVSPDDERSNRHCTDLILNGGSDIVIVTQRLLSMSESYEVFRQKYSDQDFNIFINKSITKKPKSFKDIGPALLIFGFEI